MKDYALEYGWRQTGFYISTCYIYTHRTHYIHLETSLWSTGINSSRWSQKSQTYWNTAARWFRPGIVSLWIQKRLCWLVGAKSNSSHLPLNLNRSRWTCFAIVTSVFMKIFHVFWFFWRVFNCFQLFPIHWIWMLVESRSDILTSWLCNRLSLWRSLICQWLEPFGWPAWSSVYRFYRMQ